MQFTNRQVEFVSNLKDIKEVEEFKVPKDSQLETLLNNLTNFGVGCKLVIDNPQYSHVKNGAYAVKIHQGDREYWFNKKGSFLGRINESGKLNKTKQKPDLMIAVYTITEHCIGADGESCYIPLKTLFPNPK